MVQLVPKSPEQDIPDQNYSHIKLSDDEAQEALRQARERKHYELKRIAYLEHLNTPRLIQRFKAIELKERLTHSRGADGARFIIDKDNQQQVDMLCLYFSNDPRMEECGLRPDKGILLMGGLGVGKTHLMSFFFQNQLQSYKVVSCRRIENQWVEAGKGKEESVDIIQSYIQPQQIAVNSDPFGHKEIGVCFDDLGTETIPSKRFGEEKNVLAEIILGRYDARVNFNRTHFTTNLNPDRIQVLYGDRIRDRLAEMCNLIIFDDDAKSRRK